MMYKFDMHVHTAETSQCGNIEAVEVVRLYKNAGYTGIVITDHYYKDYFGMFPELSWGQKIDHFLSGYHKAREEGDNVGLTVLLGMEIRFTENENDYLIYGLDEVFLKENPELYKLSLKDFKALMERENMLVFQAHPFRPRMVRANPALLDGVEVYNGNARHDSKNDLTYSFAQQNNLMMVSGSDFHEYEDLARGGIIIPENVSSQKQLIEVLKKGRNIELICKK